MFNDYWISELARMRREELLEETRMARLLSESKASRPSLGDRLLLKSGNILILLGERLKERREPRIETQLALQNPALKEHLAIDHFNPINKGTR